MIRVLVFVIGVIAAALSLAWLADRPGAITIEWLGYEIKTSAFVGALALAALVTVLILAWALLRYLFPGLPPSPPIGRSAAAAKASTR